jgi:Xaa-Pro aminopeptidase
MDYAQRVNNLRQKMEANGLDGFLVSKPENLYYLSGFTGEGLLVLTAKKLYLVTDPRYTEQAKVEAVGWEVYEQKQGYIKALPELCQGLSKIGFESRHLTFEQYLKAQEAVGERLEPRASLVEELRRVKEPEELARIRQAVAIGDAAFQELLPMIAVGTRERDLAIELERLLKLKGCSREAFDTIAVAGERASLPHGQPTENKLARGDMLTLDFGGFYRGYAGDTTRTVAIGGASPRLRDIYYRVLEAQMAGIDRVKAGVSCQEVDGAARECLKTHELDTYFVHSTGHGLGLEVHEEPAVSARSEVVLEENMVVTIEPGVYIPGWGGVRIEDVVIVKKTGCEILTAATKELLIL